MPKKPKTQPLRMGSNVATIVVCKDITPTRRETHTINVCPLFLKTGLIHGYTFSNGIDRPLSRDFTTDSYCYKTADQAAANGLNHSLALMKEESES